MRKRKKAGRERKIGSFSSDRGEYVIQEMRLVRPWFNSMANKRYAVWLSHAGGGYSIHDLTLRMNPYDERRDEPGKFVYVRDDATGEFWSCSFKPVMDPRAEYLTRVGRNYTVFECSRQGVETGLRVLVPVDEAVEVWTVRVKNSSRKDKRLSVFPFLSWQVSTAVFADDAYQWYSRAWRDSERVLAVSYNDRHRLEEEFVGFVGLSVRPSGWETSERAFLGDYYAGYARPRAVLSGKLQGREAFAEQACAAFRVRMKLRPGQEKCFHLIAGFATDAEDRARLVERFSDDAEVERAFDANGAYWEGFSAKAFISTPERKLDPWANVWLKYQVAVSAVRSRTKSMRFGYRDILQDLRGLLPFEPEYVRSRLLEPLRYQFADGHALRQWSRVGSDHDARDYFDSSLWLTHALCAYVKETGDLSALDETSPFFDSDERATFLEHALRGIEYVWSRQGAHGLCLIGHGDINDPFDMVGRGGRGESVWLTQFLHYVLLEMEGLACFTGRDELARTCAERASVLREAVNGPGWDGEWFVRCFDDGGEPIGSKRNDEGSIHLLSQSWAILSGAGTEEHARKALESVERLLCTDRGYATLRPPYTRKSDRIGQFTALLSHMNGNTYVHHTAFHIAALVRAGMPERALEALLRLLPLEPKGLKDTAECEPYALTNCFLVEGSERPNEAQDPWATGGTSWLHFTLTEHMLGARPDYEGLRIDPCIPAKWRKCSLRREFRGAVYEIEIRNPEGVNRGVKEVRVDGGTLDGDLIRPHADGRVHRVRVVMG